LADKKLEVTYQIVKEQNHSPRGRELSYAEPRILAVPGTMARHRRKNPTREDPKNGQLPD